MNARHPPEPAYRSDLRGVRAPRDCILPCPYCGLLKKKSLRLRFWGNQSTLKWNFLRAKPSYLAVTGDTTAASEGRPRVLSLGFPPVLTCPIVKCFPAFFVNSGGFAMVTPYCAVASDVTELVHVMRAEFTSHMVILSVLGRGRVVETWWAVGFFNLQSWLRLNVRGVWRFNGDGHGERVWASSWTSPISGMKPASGDGPKCPSAAGKVLNGDKRWLLEPSCRRLPRYLSTW